VITPDAPTATCVTAVPLIEPAVASPASALLVGHAAFVEILSALKMSSPC